jgi:hypothetical protein
MPEPGDDDAGSTDPHRLHPGGALGPPAGSWVEDEVLTVMESSFEGQQYRLTAYWSSTQGGFCTGVMLFADKLWDGAYPVNCQPEPGIGGGGLAVDGDGQIVAYAYTPATIDRATVDIDGVTYEATLHQIPEFPEYTFAVFELPPQDDSFFDDFQMPHRAYLSNDGEPVGLG